MKRHFRASTGPPEAEKLAEALGRDPDYMLGGALLGLEETGNPYWAWHAVAICIKAKKPFPDWLTTYLAECADRMRSKKAKNARDLRAVLPWILGFPKKHGPGNPLDVDSNQHKKAFALAFAIQLDKGDAAPAARRNACNEIFGQAVDDIDDRTLQRWLLEVFNLEKAPPTVGEWKNAVNKFFRPYLLALPDLERWAKSRGILS
jgi:hypothetical protein